MKTIAVTIEESMLTELDSVCRKSGGRPRSECVREALSAYLEERRRRLSDQADAKAYARYGARRLKRELEWLVRNQAKL